MAKLSAKKLATLWSECDQKSADKGKGLEHLLKYLFERIPGVVRIEANVLDAAKAQEVDLSVFHEQRRPSGLWFLPQQFLIECKNLAVPVSAPQVVVFAEKLRNGAVDLGVIASMHGITGNKDDLSAANAAVASNLREGRKILVLTGDEMRAITTTEALVKVLMIKATRLPLERGFC